jgi:hypothetical protein
MSMRHRIAGIAAAATLACRATPVPVTQSCTPTTTPEVWVERRFPRATPPKDTALKGSLAVRLAHGTDSLDRLPPRSMISVLIAGPSTAERPDTVRLLTAEEPDGAPLWRGDQLRPGTYSASLTMQQYAAGPHPFVVAPGERIEMDVTMHHATACPAPATTTPGS